MHNYFTTNHAKEQTVVVSEVGLLLVDRSHLRFYHTV
jgi:hypothetical protein